MNLLRPGNLGYVLRRECDAMGYAARLFWQLCATLGYALRRNLLWRDQVHFLGNYSLPIITVAGLFVGFVFGLQGYYALKRYGSAESLGLLVTLSLVRELGPVVTALLFAGRAGTSLTAEIGLMKAGEQLSVMEMMAVNPIERVLSPRFWAGIFTMPLLAAMFSAMGIIGGWVVGVLMIGVDDGAFWSQIQGGWMCSRMWATAWSRALCLGWPSPLSHCCKAITLWLRQRAWPRPPRAPWSWHRSRCWGWTLF